MTSRRDLLEEDRRPFEGGAREQEPLPPPAGARQLAAMVGNQAFGALMRQPVTVPPELTLQPPVPQGPSSPAPVDTISFVDPAIEREWTAELRRQAGNRMDRAFTKYVAAIGEVRTELKDKKAEPTLLEQLLAVAVGALAPGVAGLVLSRFRDELKGIASLVIGRAMGNTDTAVKAYIKADELADKYIALDGDKAKGGLEKMLTLMKAGPGAAPVAGAGTGPVAVDALLGQFTQDFSVYIQGLDQKLGGLDRAGVLGVWAAFDANAVTVPFYVAQIKDLVKMHEEIGKAVADSTKGWGGTTFDMDAIVMLEAWGTVAPAYLHYHPGSLAAFTRGHWDFVKWVPTEMIGTAIAAGPSQPQAARASKTVSGLPYAKAGEPFGGTGLAVLGHIDDPGKEGDRVADVGGKLAYVDVGPDGIKLIKYLEGGEAEYAKVKGARQPGGIDKVDPKSLKR